MDAPSELSAFVTSVCQFLVSYPESIEVRVERGEIFGESAVSLKISCHQQDAGKIIGKMGRTLKLIEGLTRLIAARHQVKVHLTVEA